MSPEELRKKFIEDAHRIEKPRLLVKVIQKPSGSLETITNAENLEAEILYVMETYGDDFKMVKNPNIAIVNYILM
jgi:hypothetical protein